MRRQGDASSEAYVLGVLCSIPFDWYARRFVELSLNFYIFNWFPVPRHISTSPLAKRVVKIAARLAAVDARYAEWGSEVGVPVGSVSTTVEKNDLIAELDAVVSLMYGLSEDQVEHIFSTFHRGWHYESRLAAVLRHYRVWKDKA